MQEKAHGSERTTEARQGVGDEFGTRVQGTGLGCEFSRARRVNVGLRAARSECACICVSAEGNEMTNEGGVERTNARSDCGMAGTEARAGSAAGLTVGLVHLCSC